MNTSFGGVSSECLFAISHFGMSSEIGIYGLTSQGINLTLNMASKGYLVTIGNKSSDKVYFYSFRILSFVD